MCCDACPPHVVDAFFLNQSPERVESSSSFESADLLLVLAFEEKLHFWVGGGIGSIAVDFVRMRCWLTGCIRSVTWTAFGLWRRCDLVDRLTGDCGSMVDVFLDSSVGSLYRCTVEWWTRGKIRHFGSVDGVLEDKSDPVRCIVRLYAVNGYNMNSTFARTFYEGLLSSASFHSVVLSLGWDLLLSEGVGVRRVALRREARASFLSLSRRLFRTRSIVKGHPYMNPSESIHLTRVIQTALCHPECRDIVD